MMRGVNGPRSAIALLLTLAACGGEPEDPHLEHDPIALVNHEAWTVVVGRADPFFAAELPEQYSCDASFYGPELLGVEEVFSINTDVMCNYLTVEQATLADVKIGEPLHARVWRFVQTAPDGAAEAHVAIAFDGRTVWEERIPLPASSGLSAPYWTADADFPAGTKVQLHIHNHGANSWSLIELSEGSEPDPGVAQ
jgi:hypothetical protein